MPNITNRPVLFVAAAATLAAMFIAAVAFSPQDSPAEANQLENITAIAAGGNHTCALNNAGGVLCWGQNQRGQLGDGTTLDRGDPTAVVGLSSGVAAIAAGDSHSCAVLDTGGVKCWGSNRYGQLGNPQNLRDPGGNPTPLDVTDLQSGVAAISTGAAHTCVLMDSSGVKCWGWDRRGQLGDGSGCATFTCTVPRDVTGLTSGVSAIDAGAYHTCAALSTGAVKCWGQNDYSQLGAPSSSSCVDEGLQPIACADAPVDVPGLAGVTALAGGGIDADPDFDSHTCAVVAEGGVRCWGANQSGQLGDAQSCGMVCQAGTLVVDLNGDPLTGMAEVAAGGQHTCARRGSDGAVLCWGRGLLGQIGHGAAATKMRATEICAGLTCEAFTGADAIAVGLNHSCLLIDGAVRCWGSNFNGQLGDGGGCETPCAAPVNVSTSKGEFPDLVVETMRIELESGSGCATSIVLGTRVEFRNMGTADAGPFVVDVNGAQQTVDEGLAAGQESSVWFAAYTIGEDTVATVDATLLVDESNEANNSHSKILPVPTLPVTCTPTATITPRPPTPTPTPAGENGDANCDDTVNSIDAALILQRVAGLLGALPCPAGADANDDGQVNSIDAALVLQYVAGLLPEL